MNEKLSEYEVDSSLSSRDKKPMRKLIDSVAIPATGVGLGAAASAFSALKKIKRETKLYDV